ncbi:hypothetical protein BC936DRAFT_145219 [Jimgerdemannia flammicorona]|uniref:Short-chain dehydrogenase/reductase SDR n=1 Tax=Jimgerdemannia flammicorona TaxID=994334 RepID=A0A433DNN1_9FUNG|nr:hypothetical protein BC936DRAFT_145219 [Jimgerdemannia flammicorona]
MQSDTPPSANPDNHTFDQTEHMENAARRIDNISSHLAAQPCAGNYPKGLLAGEVAIITGSGDVSSVFGSQGIGKSCAMLFAKEGAYVVVTDIDNGTICSRCPLNHENQIRTGKSDAVAADINAAGGKAISVPGDVLDASFPDRLINETIKAFGKINHIVNNAGFTWDGMLHKLTDKQWDVMLAVHNTAPFRIVKAAAPHMISSTSGLHGNIGQANYATAKAGIVGLTKTIAKEWGAFGVRANTVAFGYIETRLTQAKEAGAFIEVEGKKVALGIPQGAAKAAPVNQFADIPLGRTGSPDDAAGGVLMLCTPFANYVTGHTLEVTGGKGI